MGESQIRSRRKVGTPEVIHCTDMAITAEAAATPNTPRQESMEADGQDGIDSSEQGPTEMDDEPNFLQGVGDGYRLENMDPGDRHVFA